MEVKCIFSQQYVLNIFCQELAKNAFSKYLEELLSIDSGTYLVVLSTGLETNTVFSIFQEPELEHKTCIL